MTASCLRLNRCNVTRIWGTNTELRNLQHKDRPFPNVTDFFNRLQKKQPALSATRDHNSTYLPEALGIRPLTNGVHDDPITLATRAIQRFTCQRLEAQSRRQTG